MSQLRNSTLLFLVKRSGGQVSEVCLAMKKRGFGVGRYNGAGGKVEPDETAEEAAIREAREEIGVEVKNLAKVAELSFYFPYNPEWDQLVHAYFSEEWEGEPEETEEMNPKWFNASELPFGEMWPDDEFWIPEVLGGNLLRAFFRFGENDMILEKEISVVNEL